MSPDDVGGCGRQRWRGGLSLAAAAGVLLVWACPPAVADGGTLAVAETATPVTADTVALVATDTAVTAVADTGETLQDFCQAAVEHSPDLGIAAANQDIRAAQRAKATGRLLPQVSVSTNLTHNRREALGQVDRFRGERYAVQVTQVLFDWAGLAARRRAERLESMDQAQYRLARSLLLVQVAQRYLAALQAHDELTSVGAEIDAVTWQVDQIRGLFARQLVPVTDLRRAEASLASARAEQVRLRGELELARAELRAVSGLPVGELHNLRDGCDVPPLETGAEHWVQLALESNQQLESDRLGVAAAREGISQARGGSLPSVSLVAQRQRSNVGYDNVPIRQTDLSYIGIDLSMSLFSGGSNLAARREARGTHTLAEQELRQAELEVSEQVRQTYLQLRHSEARIEAARASVTATAVSVEAMQRAAALGTVTHVDVLRAIQDRFYAERDLQKARYESVHLFLLLRHAAGTLAPEDVALVSSWFAAAAP